MTTVKQSLLQTNANLRKAMAKLGVDCDESAPGRTLEEENRRLRDDLRWILKMMARGRGRG